MDLSIGQRSAPFTGIQGNAHLVSHSVSCALDVHGYYASIFRGEEVIWETTRAFNGHARELFTLEWDLAFMQPGDQFKVFGFVRGEEGEAVQVCSCTGAATDLAQGNALTLL
ncbi:MAG: hypothetical protein K940chlam2_00801 [Chlamydiae bacterium]|nr:hypothetical protein [Chlamydiota bacterium]